MYSQVPMLIHGNTIECAFDFEKTYFRVDNVLTIGIGTCIAYFTDSDTIKNCWYWPDTDTETRNQYSHKYSYAKGCTNVLSDDCTA